MTNPQHMPQLVPANLSKIGDYIQTVFTAPNTAAGQPSQEALALAAKVDDILWLCYPDLKPSIIPIAYHKLLNESLLGKWHEDICHTMLIVSLATGADASMIQRAKPQLLDFYLTQAGQQKALIESIRKTRADGSVAAAHEIMLESKDILDADIEELRELVKHLNSVSEEMPNHIREQLVEANNAIIKYKAACSDRITKVTDSMSKYHG